MRRRRNGSRAQRTSRAVQDGSGSSLGGRTTTRALVAVGTYMAQDLRDAEGLMRPALRRAALRLALSRREPARRLGYAYLRLDPPAPKTLPAGVEVIDTTSASPPSPALTSGPGPDAQSPRGRRRRFELARFPLYHEHMLITSEEPDATSTY